MTDPGMVVLAGDWHGNTNWAGHVIEAAAELLVEEEHKLILHAGDFSIWPGRYGRAFLDEVSFMLRALGIKLIFSDGNHEWHRELRRMLAEQRGGGTGLVPIDRESPGSAVIFWAPRGHRWTWHGKTWLALGGAVSVDKALRTEGRDWWPEEVLSAEDTRRAIEGGPADVMLCHDAPTEVQMVFDTPPKGWAQVDLDRAGQHRERLQVITEMVDPELLIHGHYHRPVRQDEPRRIIGLDMDGMPGNFTVLDTRTLKEVAP